MFLYFIVIEILNEVKPMELTGKAKIEFQKWFNEIGVISMFEESLSDSMKYGVYVDFFDSVGLILDVQPVLDYDSTKYLRVIYWMVTVFTLGKEVEDFNHIEFKTRQEARVKAIEKANICYNETQSEKFNN